MTEAKEQRGCLPGSRWRRPFFPAILLLLAAVLWADPFPFSSPVQPYEPAPDWATDTTPVRQTTLRPQVVLAGFTYRCNDCHKLFPSQAERTRPLMQHTGVELKHGINTRCLNCHHLTNRDAFAGDGNAEIPFDQPQLLCAKCHGPVYRDWLHGAHGRTNGHWDASRGPVVRRKCIECHDPHTPPFPSLTPAPAPQTLRMGAPVEVDHSGPDNPLRIYRGQHGSQSE